MRYLIDSSVQCLHIPGPGEIGMITFHTASLLQHALRLKLCNRIVSHRFCKKTVRFNQVINTSQLRLLFHSTKLNQCVHRYGLEDCRLLFHLVVLVLQGPRV